MKFLIEQRIWDYLDGNGSAEERKEIHRLIEIDVEYRSVYQEMLEMLGSLSKMEMEEPSMSFSRNVMEAVKAVPRPGSVKSLIDKRVIYAITAFFIVSILTVLAVLLSQADWKPAEAISLEMKLPKVHLPDLAKDWLISGFVFLDIIIGLYFADYVIRKKLQKQPR